MSGVPVRAGDFLGRLVVVRVDRPKGSRHPDWDLVYAVNYGLVPGTVSGDGEELDAYILGVDEPVEAFEGRCVAYVRREDEDDDKLIVVPDGGAWPVEEIERRVHFVERYFRSRIVTAS